MIEWDINMQNDFDKVISYSQGFEPHTTPLFELWATRKEWMYKAMGNKLIYEFEKPVTLELDADSKKDMADHFIGWVCGRFSESLADFLETERDGFYDNKVVVPWNDIPVGMKLSKAIGRYWHEHIDPIDIDAIQTELSRCIQQNKVSGKMCLSIHPLDFLSSSENQHNWRSCHALDGEYRAGNLSYMADDCTMMVYIKSEENVRLPRFPADVEWTNKKWRCWMFFDKARGMIYAGRQYPFFSENALNLCRQVLFEPLNYLEKPNRDLWATRDLWDTYDVGIAWKHNCVIGDTEVNGENVYLYGVHIFANETVYKLDSWVQDATDSMHFNDLLRSSFYTPWTLTYNHRLNKRLKEQLPPLMIGSAIPCLYCGKDNVCNSDVMVCESCALEDPSIEAEWITYCEECGARIIRDDSYCHNDYYYCDDCVDAHTHTCEKCGDRILDFEDDYYYGKNDEILCWSCHHREISPRGDFY